MGRGGQESEVTDFIASLKENTAEQNIARAIAYAGLSDVSNSLASLRDATDAGVLPTDLRVDPKFDLLRQEPDFMRLLAEFGLKDR